MSTAGMELGKWNSNNRNILNGVISDIDNLTNLQEIDDTMTKILGLMGNSQTNIPDLKTSINALNINICSDNNLDTFKKYSSLQKMIRVFAYCQRFIHNCKNLNKRLYGVLDEEEINNTKLMIIKMVQQSEFSSEIQQLGLNGQVSTKSKLFRLRPFLDKDGIIRVGGRLKNAISIDVYQRHPIVLPGDSSFTYNLFREQHVQLMHGGPQAVLSAIRLKYWPINGRNI